MRIMPKLIGMLLLLPSCLPNLAAADAIKADQFSVQSFPDAKVIYLDFWASWCVPCRKSFPWLNEMQAKYGDKGLVVIGINEDARSEEAEHFLADHPAAFQLVMDPNGKLAEKYQLQGMPSAVLVTSDGKELHRHIGFRADREEEYEKMLVELLESKR